MIEKMGGGVGGGRVEVIAAKGCSRLFMDFSSSFRGIPTFSLEPPSPAAAAVSESPVKIVKTKGPFSGLVICVTGLSRETRKQVQEATERLGGQYSPHLHPQCTHLVVQISFLNACFEILMAFMLKRISNSSESPHIIFNFILAITELGTRVILESLKRLILLITCKFFSSVIIANKYPWFLFWVKPEFASVTLNIYYSFHGRKFEHAMKHGTTNGLFLVTIGWFVDSVKRNVRLNETLYSVNTLGDNGLANYDSKRLDQNSGAENSCIPSGLLKQTKQPDFSGSLGSHFSERQIKRQTASSSLTGQSFYVDVDVPAELRTKVAEVLSAEGAILLDQWFAGCSATHVVCEGPSVQKYMGYSSNIVTPLWVLKSAKEKSLQRLFCLSADLARYTGAMLDTSLHGVPHEGTIKLTSSAVKTSQEERQIKVNLAKDGVRKRRNRQMQTCQTPIRPITPASLLNSICWSISEPTSTASIFIESSSVENATEDQASVFFDAKADGKESEASFVNLSRPLTESEKSELIFRGPFFTIMFPVDRFSEMGPCSRTFFSNKGFTCLQVLDYIYAFYQESMSSEEIELAIHTDSRHADRLRSIYSSKETADVGRIEFRRIDFLGSRKSFEMLKRVQGDNSSNLYELLIRA